MYGTEEHHALVREKCVAYMWENKDYFRASCLPDEDEAVGGDDEVFAMYLEEKARDGSWGDEPEIQALCEM